ncbi:MAG: RNA 2'-phosphotransferase [Desulfatitalea sp.]
MPAPQAIKKLAKFMEYILARRPDEFGLIPDPDGFVKIKTLLQAVHEDPEWRHLKEAHLTTLIATERPAPIEIQGAFVRAQKRDQLPAVTVPGQWPKLLYTTVRQRAYPVVHEKGLRPGVPPFIVLSSDIAMADRLGRRSDNTPVLLTVHVANAQAAGTHFRQFGESLFLADTVPAECISGPPLSKEKPATAVPKAPAQAKTPGSFFPDLGSADKHGVAPHQRPQRNEIEWKKDRRRARKEKDRQWR